MLQPMIHAPMPARPRAAKSLSMPVVPPLLPNKVLSTSTVLLNDPLGDVLAHCARARVSAMIAPGTSCLPDALFKRGVTLVGGAWIEDAEGFKRALAAGEPWWPHARKFARARGTYPGTDTQLARLT
jgi:hypothetical protein